MWEYILIFFLGIIATLIAFPLKDLFINLGYHLFSDVPNVSGSWDAYFNEPDEKRNTVQTKEAIKLRQFGRIIWGEGTTCDALHREFKYKGRLVRSTLLGEYRRKKPKQLAGHGRFQLKVSADNNKMNGHCLWYDKDTDDIQSSEYKWERSG
jgi:hypothetical protein